MIFQPELRRALEQIGRGKLLRNSKAKSNDLEIERIVNAFVDALTRLARRRVGALIVIEGNTGLKDVIESGTLVDARISAALIENIFEPNYAAAYGAVSSGRKRIRCGLHYCRDRRSVISRDLARATAPR